MEDYIKLQSKLQLGKNSDVKYVKESDIDDIEKLDINTNLPKIQRMINFLKDVKNPYIFMVNGIKVKFEFSKNNISINQCFENLIINKKC